ncbi:MAG TPA: CHAT domain-containing protein [Pyrinomonadaceae bacterium]|jgi:hypothetical protein
MEEYAELEVGLYRQQGTVYAVELRFQLPEQYDQGKHEARRGYAEFDAQKLDQLKLDPEEYGRELTRSLFAHPLVSESYDRALTSAGDLPVRLRLYVDPSAADLHNLRWELLRDPRHGSRLLTSERVLFSRFLASTDWAAVQPRSKGRLRALVVVASSPQLNRQRRPGLGASGESGAAGEGGGERLEPLDVEGELARAQASLKGVVLNTLVSRDEPPTRVTLPNLLNSLRRGYDILYLVCHGAFYRSEPKSSLESFLYLEDDEGGVMRVAGQELVDSIRDLRRRPLLVVLASCRSAGEGEQARAGDEGALAALGPRLAEAGVAAVVAMQGDVLMETMARFMPAFFERLTADGEVDLAMATARAAVLGSPDWWMPVLFMRLRNGSIWYEPGFARGEKDYDRWPDLLSSIKQNRCTPVIGFGLTEFLLGPPREIARRWAENQNFPLARRYQDELHQVAQYLAVSQSPSYARDKLIEFLLEEVRRDHGDARQAGAQLNALVSEIGARRRRENEDDAFRVLAGLPLSIYITANADDLLADALAEQGKKPEVVICRWNSYVDTLETVYQRERGFRPTVERPLVYHLFGRLAEPKSLVLTEDDYFDYLMRVNSNDADIPVVVDAAWCANALLFLGFQLDDWDFRVLFRSILNDERREKKRDYRSVAVQLSPGDANLQPGRARRYLEQYFGDAKIGTYWGSAGDFAAELRERRAAAEGGRAG